MEAAVIEDFFRSLVKEGLYQGVLEWRGREYRFSPTLGLKEKGAKPLSEKKSRPSQKEVPAKKQPSRVPPPEVSRPDRIAPGPFPFADEGPAYQEGQKVRVRADGSAQVVNPGRSGMELSELERGVKGRKTYLFIAMSVLAVIIILALVLLTVT